jgi:TolB-like protein/Tfp pilus assembly protein PilF
MSPNLKPDSQLEIGHIVFMEIVDYAKLSLEEQTKAQDQLNSVVRNGAQFRAAEAEGKLVRLPTADGLALVFFNSSEAAMRCAVEISGGLSKDSQLRLRIGLHSGPVSMVKDVNDRSNIAGPGINIAQRVMDLGDPGHILLSRRGAEDLSHSRQWRPHLHDLGEFQAKHGLKIDIVNYYTDGIGNKHLPAKLAANRKQVRLRKRLFFAAATLIFLVLAMLMWIFLRRPAGDVGATLLEKSIAVLPFENFSDNKESAYFADGVQDDILTDLAKVADLKVISRRSVAQYRGSTKAVRDIGQALHVAYVLEGTVRKIGDKIRVTAQLIDTRTEAQTWADKYDRDLADVFAVQSEVSHAIIGQLKAALSPAEKTRIETTPTRDMVAYDLYLQAKELIFSSGGTKDAEPNIAKAINLLDQAVARDGSFALAYSLLSQMHVHRFRFATAVEGDLEKARTYAERALRLAPELGEAHLAQARYFYEGLRDYQRALPEFSVASQALPNNADVLSWSGILKRRMGRWAEALRDQQKAMELDPHNTTTLDLIVTFRLLRDYAAADHTVDRALISLPQLANTLRLTKAHIALGKGDIKRCQDLLHSLPPDYQQGGFVPYLQATVAVYERNYAEAARILAQVPQDTDFAKQWVSRDQAFLAHAQGDAVKARQLFQTARDVREADKRGDPVEKLSMLAIYDAGLGRKTDALRESQMAVDLFPKGGDATDGPHFLRFQALVLAWTGEHERALQLLLDLVSRPGDLTPGELKFDPAWDDVRGDPRFAAITAATEQPAKIDNH